MNPHRTDPSCELEELRSRVEEYERWFRVLDDQLRILEQERQKLSAVVNHTDAGFLVVDSSLQVVWTNRILASRFCSVSDPSHIVGQTCNQALCRRETICDNCPTSRLFEFGSVQHSEIAMNLGGQVRYIYTTAMPIKSPEGRIDQSIVMLQDISDLAVLRRSEEVLRANEERFCARSVGADERSG